VIQRSSVSAKEIEILAIGTELDFCANRCLLRLAFQHRIVDNDKSTAEHNINTGLFKAKFAKAVPGEDFSEIVLLTTLRPTPPTERALEIISRSARLEYIAEGPDLTWYGAAFRSTNFVVNLHEIIHTLWILLTLTEARWMTVAGAHCARERELRSRSDHSRLLASPALFIE
jgi:hypothetical protein